MKLWWSKKTAERKRMTMKKMVILREKNFLIHFFVKMSKFIEIERTEGESVCTKRHLKAKISRFFSTF